MSRSRDVSAVQNNLGVAIPPAAAGKNAIINGGFDIWQRGTSIALTAASAGSGYLADRWQGYRGVAGSTCSRQATNDTTNLPFIQYCARVQRDSGNTSTSNIAIGQSIESLNSIRFAGQIVTISFYARAGANYSAASSIMRLRLLSSTTTDQNILVNGGTTVIDQNVTLTTTWQRFSYTSAAVVGATAVTLGSILSYDPVGTAGANDYFEVTGVQLELGSSATPFSRAGGNIQGELAACQRYYYRNIANGAFTLMTNLGGAESATSARFTVQHPVTMRTAPNAVEYSTLIVYSPSGGTNSTVSSFTTVYGGAQVSLMTAGVTGLTANASYYLYTNNSTSGYIAFSAEL